MARSKSSRRSPGRYPNRQVSSAAALVILLIIAACRSYHPADGPRGNGPISAASRASNLLLGNPSSAGTSADNYLLVKPYFVLSYNNAKGEPNWVSWRLTRGDLGDAPRRRNFETDSTLPFGFKQIADKDYTGSGYDRGHLCPHGDRTKNLAMSYGTFVMTNIIPQAHNLNEKAWDSLEIYCRALAKSDNDRLYITDGPAGSGGTGIFGRKAWIATGKVAVPAVCWKVIVVVPDDGTEDLTDITASTRVIAVIMPNDQNVGFEWDSYRVSVADVEKLTGYHFFSTLPSEVAAMLRSKVDRVTIPPPQHQAHYNEKKSSPRDWN